VKIGSNQIKEICMGFYEDDRIRSKNTTYNLGITTDRLNLQLRNVSVAEIVMALVKNGFSVALENGGTITVSGNTDGATINGNSGFTGASGYLDIDHGD
jgi:hypothetical protein